MLKPIRNIVHYSSSKKGAKVTLIIWIIALIAFSLFAPSAKDYETSSNEGSVSKDTASELAEQIKMEQFPSDDGLTALLVFHRNSKITNKDREIISKLSKWLNSDAKPKNIASALPFHEFPKKIQDQMFSEDETTLLLNISLQEGLESKEIHETLAQITEQVETYQIGNLQFEITGPGGITSDTITLFKNGDFVLMIGTVILIFIILILIYRSPILAITPLIIAGIVYGIVDRLLGLAGKLTLFAIDSSAVSIMLVLLFAVLTDYSLFIFSRYREELRKYESKYTAMGEAIYHVAEPIFFSGGTIVLAMLTLFVAVFKPYHHFAPVFSVAVIIIAIAGLTLIPSIFALMGRKAFWPFIPEVERNVQPQHTFWGKIGNFVKNHPLLPAGTLLAVLLVVAINVTTINYSFNLLKSFPDDISSRVGYELLEEHYPAGQLAPVTVVLKADKPIDINPTFIEHVTDLQNQFADMKNVSSVSPGLTNFSSMDELPRNFLADSKKAIKLQLTLASNPYDQKALNTIEELRQSSQKLLAESGFSKQDYQLHFAGQTAEQLDVREMNKRDTILLFTLIIVFITLVLGWQTRSMLLPLIMVGTILLSYVATLGFSWWIFQHWLGLDSISYRLPVYTFIFMVALGIDYNIMLVSRIKELAKDLPWKEAIANGVAHTGGVISSAGLILAATFSVLMTQPLQELFLFGFTMALGILLDTFLIRGILLPAILVLMKPKKIL